MKTITLVDGNPLMWQATYSKSTRSISSYIVSTFFESIVSKTSQDVLVFWDSGESRWRKSMYPAYKANREDRKKDFDLVMMGQEKEEAKKILSYFGIRNITVPGVEADDLISIFSGYLSKVFGYNVIIASRDHDLWQLLNDKISSFDSISGYLVTASTAENISGVPVNRIPDLKALKGDSSDNIKGIPKIGDKTATKLISENGGLLEVLQESYRETLLSKKATSNIVHNLDMLERDYQLVKLPDYMDAHSFLNHKEKEVLQGELTKPCEVDSVRADYEAAKLGFFRYFNGLDQELSHFVQYYLNRDFPDTSTQAELDSLIMSCQGCSLRNPDEVPALATGQDSADFVFLLRDPSKSVKPVYELIDKMGLDPVRCWITYVVRCKCTYPPDYGCISKCTDLFTKEFILRGNVKMMIGFGNEASFVMDQGSLARDACGQIKEYLGHYFTVLPDPDLAAISEARKVDYDYGVSKILEFLEEKRNGRNS